MSPKTKQGVDDLTACLAPIYAIVGCYHPAEYSAAMALPWGLAGRLIHGSDSVRSSAMGRSSVDRSSDLRIWLRVTPMETHGRCILVRSAARVECGCSAMGVAFITWDLTLLLFLRLSSFACSPRVHGWSVSLAGLDAIAEVAAS